MSTLKPLVVVLLSVALVSCANRGPKTPAAVRTSLERADALIASGQPEGAVPLYEKILETQGLPAATRAQALYGLAALRLSGYPAVRDLDKARPLLQELHDTHPGEHPLEVSSALWLLADLTAADQRLKAETEARRLEGEYARIETERARSASQAQAQAQATEAARSAEASRQASQREVAALNDRLLAAEEEMRKKDELLKRLTERMLK